MLITDQESLKQYEASKCLWAGIPGIEVTKQGRTYLTFYSGGTKEGMGNHATLVCSDDGVDFSRIVAVCYEEGQRCFDPCLWIDPLGRLWFMWARSPGDGVFATICEEPDAENPVFGEVFQIGNNVMMNKPTVLSTGEWAFPIAVWNHGIHSRGYHYESPIEPKGAFIYVTSDCGKTFRKLGGAEVDKRSFDEHMLLELENGVLRCFVRTTYGIGAADSYDGGLHWGKDFDTGYGGPSSRFFIRRLPSGRILLINHYEFTGRNNLTAMLSEDDGKTFPYRLLLDERERVAYPDATIDPEGRICITYDRERGGFCSSMEEVMQKAREILIARIREEDILNGALVSADSYLKQVAYKLTDYDGDVENPYEEPERFSDGGYAGYLQNCGEDAEQIVERIMDAYGINCTNIHNIEAERLDSLITKYRNGKELSVLVEIIALIRSAHSESTYSEKGIVDMLCRYMSEHPEEDCSTEELAARFHFSAHYLRHVFKKETGISVSAFRTAQIIKKAKLLLQMGDGRITDVAASCGFDNPSWFAEVFQREVGVSPKEYRQGCLPANNA